VAADRPGAGATPRLTRVLPSTFFEGSLQVCRERVIGILWLQWTTPTCQSTGVLTHHTGRTSVCGGVKGGGGCAAAGAAATQAIRSWAAILEDAPSNHWKNQVDLIWPPLLPNIRPSEAEAGRKICGSKLTASRK
jgi:hypothetical protein